MSEVVTRAEFEELRRMIEETYWYAKRGAAISVAAEERERWIATVERHCDPTNRRFRSGTPIYRLGLDAKNSRPLQILMEDADVLTLEEAAARGRDSLANVAGIGPLTLKALDAAMSERGLTWAEAV
jgi:hypothetical protein